MSDPNNNRFDAAAKTWDENPARIQLADAVVAAIAAQVPLSAEMDAMDYGCGTGLVTLLLAPRVRTIVGADSSTGMLEVLGEKIEAGGIVNARALRLDLSTDPQPAARFDLIVSNMTLHHVERPLDLIHALRGLLRPGGYFCISDLDTEPGDFHQDLTGVRHFGFDRAEIVALFEQAGLADVSTVTAHSLRKPVEGQGLRDFSVFLATGHKEA